jgi:uncharacterized ferredoxin-like protein
MIKSSDLERSAALQVAQLMAAAARTAPKGRGIDNIEIFAIDDEGDTKDDLIEKMLEIAKDEARPSMERDANNIAGAHAIVVIGVRSAPAGLNCGYCGHSTCEELKKEGGICAFNSMDLGIATSSAASIASLFHIDNRLMYSIGRAAIDLKLFSSDVKQALGLPLSVTGKNPYFDRK